MGVYGSCLLPVFYLIAKYLVAIFNPLASSFILFRGFSS